MSEQTENKLLLITIFLLYGVVGGVEMREQQEFEELAKVQYMAVKNKQKKPLPPKPSTEPPKPSTEPQKCKIRTKTDSCIVRLA